MTESVREKSGTTRIQLQSLPEEQREQMEKVMGEQMDMMTGMMSGDPVVAEVRSVRVNTELPRVIFSDSKTNSK